MTGLLLLTPTGGRVAPGVKRHDPRTTAAISIAYGTTSYHRKR
jgi:hypothetical protein